MKNFAQKMTDGELRSWIADTNRLLGDMHAAGLHDDQLEHNYTVALRERKSRIDSGPLVRLGQGEYERQIGGES